MSQYVERKSPVLSGLADIDIQPGTLVKNSTAGASSGSLGTGPILHFTSCSVATDVAIGVAMGTVNFSMGGSVATSTPSGSIINVAPLVSGQVVQVKVIGSVIAGSALTASYTTAKFGVGNYAISASTAPVILQWYDAIATVGGADGDLVTAVLA